MTVMTEKLIDLVDYIVYRVPTPAQVTRMSDADAERRYMEAVLADKQRVGLVIAREIDRRDLAARLARQDREARQRAQERARARERTARHDYDVAIHAMFLQAERDCRGVLLNKAAAERGTDPISLFSGPAARAHKLASEELRNWWLDHPRLTYADFKRQSREHYDPTAAAA
jgi:hypothetical protein